MSMLLFYVGENGYAIESRDVLRVIPLIILKKMFSAPKYIAGLLNWEGKLIPVVDFCQLIEQRPTRFVLSSRIILIQGSLSNSERILGIMGENVEDLLPVGLKEFNPIEFSLVPFPYLNRIFNTGNEIIQYLDLKEFFRFLSADLFHIIEKEDHGF